MRIVIAILVTSACGFELPEEPDPRDCEQRTVYFEDSDGDGLGADDHMRFACSQPTGWSATGGDCDDTDASVTSECHEFDTGGEEEPEDTAAPSDSGLGPN